MNVEKVINESVKQNEQILDLSKFKTLTEADLNLVLFKVETHFNEVKLSPTTRLNPKCKAIYAKIELKLTQKQQPTDNIYNLLAHHTYCFNFKYIIRDDNEVSASNGVFQCCSPVNNNKVDVFQNKKEFNLNKQLEEDDWNVQEIFNEKGYLSILYMNNKSKQMVLAFQGIRLAESDFTDNNQILFAEQLLAKKCIQMAYAYAHAKKSVRIANKKNFTLSFTGYSFGAWLAERMASLFQNELKKKYSKSVTFKSNGSLDHSEKLFSILNKNKDSFKNWDLMEYLLAPYYSESKD